MPITDYRQQALDESRSFAERQREQKRQSAFVRQEMPGFAKANPQGFDVHAQGLYAALQSQRGHSSARRTAGAEQHERLPHPP